MSLLGICSEREIKSTGVPDLGQALLIGGSPVALTPEFFVFPSEPGSPRHSHSLLFSLKDVFLTRRSQIIPCHQCWLCEATSVYCVFPKYNSVTVDK